MYYVPVTATYYSAPVNYVPMYSTVVERQPIQIINRQNDEDLSRVKRELTELREELNELRLEKTNCSICSSTSRSTRAEQNCSICSTRSRLSPVRETYSPPPPPSPIHFCSICDDYVIDSPYPPLRATTSYSPRVSRRTPRKVEDDKLSEYLPRQIDLQRLRHSYIPQTRPEWIPTAYKHDYPHRRWATRHAHFSEP